MNGAELLALVLLVACGLAVARRDQQMRAEDWNRVLLIGDSLAVGLDQPMAALARSTGRRFSAVAVKSTTLAQWTRTGRVASAVRDAKPTVVLVVLGTNDAAGMHGDAASRARAVSAFETQARSLSQQVAANSPAKVVWLLPPAMPFDTRFIRSAAEAIGARVVAAPPGIERTPDRVHCTGRGYRAWAGAVWPAR